MSLASLNGWYADYGLRNTEKYGLFLNRLDCQIKPVRITDYGLRNTDYRNKVGFYNLDYQIKTNNDTIYPIARNQKLITNSQLYLISSKVIL